MPKDIEQLMEITDQFNYWQDERKKKTFLATHYVSLFLKEITRRTPYTLHQLHYSLPPEIPEIVEEKIPPKELSKRRSHCVVLWAEDTYSISSNTSLIRTLNTIGKGARNRLQKNSIKGMSASLGKTHGRVIVLTSAKEIHKVRTGDILVTIMTRPDYLPAMQKASAFITDEGGITCHAAIIAREMKKPCIIGTKIATKVLQNNDRVEVDAENGIVRVLRRGK